MKYAVVLAAGATLALGACQGSEETATEASASATPTAEATAAAAPAATGTAAAFTAGQPPSKEFMVGTWGEGDACELPINFQADGTIKDGPMDKWTIENGQLVMDDLIKLNLKVVDATTMSAVPDGAPEAETKTLKRCGA